MFKLAPFKKIAVPLLLLFVLLLTFQSCKKKRSEMAEELFTKTHNKIFKDATNAGFGAVFNQVFVQRKSKLNHADFIDTFYKKNHYTPVFVLNHLFNGDLDKAVAYFMQAGDQGLNAEMFQPGQLKEQVQKLNNQQKIKTLDEAYHDMAELELTAANSMINYTNDLQYGVISPKRIYERYFMATKRPDGISMLQVFHIGNMQNYLDSIQPKDPQYLALKSALKNSYQLRGFSPEETKRIILVNLERLRWRNKPAEDEYVMVNVPDFTLKVVDSGKSVLNMKVCVGQGRNSDYANTLASYNDTCRDDKPAEHETPLLNSQIYGVEVNPVWNIPESIANKEIIVEAAKDKFYLGNNNIDVYDKKDKLVENPEDIDWSTITKDNLPYRFKQEPGSGNSLGLIKFLFENKSNVYLHDTPAKSAFYERMRAISHGCVRLGDPRGLAKTLFGDGDQFKTISDDMDDETNDPTMIYLQKKVPVYITYITCWSDDKGKIQFRKDVYGLDIVLYDHLMKFVHPEM